MNTDSETVEAAIPAITCWEDIYSRARYADDIDSTKTQLLDVIAPYRGLQPQKPCGLTNCHTPHNNGYLIVTADGRETNIGDDCGKKHFPEFAAQTRKINRILREQRLRNIVIEAQARISAVQLEIADLRAGDYGAEWTVRCISSLRLAVTAAGAQLWLDLKRRANVGDATVNKVRERSKAEIQELIAANLGRADELRYESISVGRISGLELLSNRLDLHTNLVRGAEKAVDDIRAVDAKRTSGKTLQATSKLVSELDAHLVLVREALAAGRLFFTDANLALLAYIAADAEKRKKLADLTVNKLATSPSSR